MFVEATDPESTGLLNCRHLDFSLLPILAFRAHLRVAGALLSEYCVLWIVYGLNESPHLNLGPAAALLILKSLDPAAALLKRLSVAAALLKSLHLGLGLQETSRRRYWRPGHFQARSQSRRHRHLRVASPISFEERSTVARAFSLFSCVFQLLLRLRPPLLPFPPPVTCF
jgi:hypothetical protein